MGKITITELVNKANGYFYGIARFQTADGLITSIAFNKAREMDKCVVFEQVNQDDVKIILNQDDIVSIEDKSAEGSIYYAVELKAGMIIKVFLFQKKGEEAEACHALYGSYDDYLKELDLYELEEKVNKTKKAFVSISDESSYIRHTYEHICLEDMDILDGTCKLTLFNGKRNEKSDKLSFTLYDDKVNDVWLMNGADGWEGLKLRLCNQPFTEVRISLLYK